MMEQALINELEEIKKELKKIKDSINDLLSLVVAINTGLKIK